MHAMALSLGTEENSAREWPRLGYIGSVASRNHWDMTWKTAGVDGMPSRPVVRYAHW